MKIRPLLPRERREETLEGSVPFTDPHPHPTVCSQLEKAASILPPSRSPNTCWARLGLHHFLVPPGATRAWHRAGAQQMFIG